MPGFPANRRTGMTNRLWAAALAAALVTAAVAVPHAEIIEQVIVKVNGEIITKTEFEQRQVAGIRPEGERRSRSRKS